MFRLYWKQQHLPHQQHATQHAEMARTTAMVMPAMAASSSTQQSSDDVAHQ